MDKERLQAALKTGSTHRAARVLKCSQTNVRYWMKVYGLKTQALPRNRSITGHEKDAFCNAVKTCSSIAGVIREMGRVAHGTNYRQVRRWVEELNLDTSHWTGQHHGTSGAALRIDWSLVLVKNSKFHIGKLRKRRLIQDNILKEECAICGRGPHWNNKPLVLRLDHENGIRSDNRRENLRLLCPNCDSQTDTYCGKNKKASRWVL